MVLKCNCGYKENTAIHKDGYELIAFVCPVCRSKALAKAEALSIKVSNFKRITLQNGDWFYIPRLKKAS